jgi:simple sugar transport system ATP-binding protein
LSKQSEQGADLFELRGVTMDFGSIRALDDITIQLRAGEVVGVVGDNGAGKSTLVKIITGYHRPTRGSLHFQGEKVDFASPHDARAVGIEAVYQDLALLEELSLWRNFFLGKELRRKLASLSMLRVHEMRDICLRELKQMGLTRLRSADEPASLLSGGERQSLAITRAVHFGARVLILDEPTAALSVRETRKVFGTIDAARQRGLGVIYIDHNMAHVHPVADRIVFLEHGKIKSTFTKGEVSLDELIEMIALSGTTEPDLAHDVEQSSHRSSRTSLG